MKVRMIDMSEALLIAAINSIDSERVKFSDCDQSVASLKILLGSGNLELVGAVERKLVEIRGVRRKKDKGITLEEVVEVGTVKPVWAE